MKFPRIYQAVHFAPWLITPAGHATVAALLEQKISAKKIKARADEDDDTDFFGDPLPTMTIDPASGLAVIPIRGTMARGIGRIERMCGACDTAQVIAWIAEAEASPFVRVILFDVDSPGGTVDGTAELGAAIAAMRKPNAAYVLSMACSAAYWAASQCDQIFACPSAEVGSIGVLMGSMDYTILRQAAQLPDISITRPTEAPLKAAGAYGTPLTPEQQAQRQEQCDWLHQQFMTAVTTGRPQVMPESMRGQTFFGAQGVEAGLIDEICARDYAIASIL